MTSLRTNLFWVALALSLFGLVTVYSATYMEFGERYLFLRAGHIVLGVVAFLVVSRIRYTAWRRISPVLYFVVLASLVLVLIPGIGVEVGGARRWFDLGVISLQPAEFAKVAAIVVLSCAVARYRPGTGLPVGPMLGVGLLFVLVVLEPDFGTSVVLLTGVAGVLWASEVRTRDLLVAGGLAVGGLVGVMWLEPYRRERFMTFLDPWSTADGSGYQIVQSLVAIKSGDVFGTGAGSGGQGITIPEVQTDMIFALIGEELGLLGMIAVIGAFCFIAVAGFRIALLAPSVMARCLAAGLTTMLAAQAIFNIGAAMNVVPLAGMTLPFISYGGSSLIVCFTAVGILYRISEDSERAREARPRRRKSRSAGTVERVSAGAGPDRRRRYGGTRHSRALRG
ncbi:MAG: putative lipid II flippase FtsW [Actinomycetota bacterium]|nr:putative lipid II flippase FtsW [Actinomycetota bacterium]